MKLDSNMSTRTVVDTNIIAVALISEWSKKIAQNLKIELDYNDGKIKAKISVNEDYIRGISDVIESLSELEVDIYG